MRAPISLVDVSGRMIGGAFGTDKHLQAEKEEKDEQEKTRKAEIEAREAKRRAAAAGPKKGASKKK